MALSDDTKVIGYFAYASATGVICDGDACIIAGTEADLRRYISEAGPAGNTSTTLRKTRFGEIMMGLKHGGAYVFDEVAYNRFYPLARRNGLDLGAEEFSPTPTGRHFVRVQLMHST